MNENLVLGKSEYFNNQTQMTLWHTSYNSNTSILVEGNHMTMAITHCHTQLHLPGGLKPTLKTPHCDKRAL